MKRFRTTDVSRKPTKSRLRTQVENKIYNLLEKRVRKITESVRHTLRLRGQFYDSELVLQSKFREEKLKIIRKLSTPLQYYTRWCEL